MKQQNQKQDDIPVQDQQDVSGNSQAPSDADVWKDKYLRALADYQNVTKRTQEEVSMVRIYAAERILSRLLPVLDTFLKAQAHLKDPGLDLAVKEMLAVLEEEGIKKIDTVGKAFDPHLMECIEVVEGKDNIVVEEVGAGYTLHDKMLRVSQVKVGKKSTN